MSDPNETPKVNNEETNDTGWETLDYREVDTKEYVEAGLADGSLEVFEAVKFARISAERGEVGQEVISWSEDEDGNPIQERVSTVEVDPETGEPGWIATKTDSDGNPIIDKNGHTNQWIIDAKTFRKKYEEDPEHPGIFRPVGGPQKFVQTSENLTISQWGEKMNMPKGSYINITNPDDMYAINPRDFDDTYSAVENEPADQPEEDSTTEKKVEDMDTKELLEEANKLHDEIMKWAEDVNKEIKEIEELIRALEEKSEEQ